MRKIDANAVNPYIRVAMHSVITQGQRISQRVIYDYELIYINGGGMTFYYNGIAYECKKGQFILIRPGVAHAFDCSRRELSQPHIHFDLCYASDSTSIPISFKDKPHMTTYERDQIREDAFADYPHYPFVIFSNTQHATSLFYRVIDLFSTNQQLLAKAALIELLFELIRDNFADVLSAECEEKFDVAIQLKDYIDSTHGIGISLNALEKQFSYSKFHLERKFKQRYGVSLIAYTNQKRMDRARSLLNDMTVSEVAEASGFSSIYSFSRAYKNHFGMSPLTTKKQA